MDTFFDRLLNLINEKAAGKYTVFAKKAEIPVGTFQAYLKDRLPHPNHLVRIHETYDVNLNWLLTGKGEKYISKKIDSKKSKQINEDPEIAELLEGARKVLKSGNRAAVDALERNIRYFSHAVETEKEVSELKLKLGHIEQTMESRLAAIEVRFQNDRRKEQRRKRDDGPPTDIDRRVLPGRRNGIDHDGSWPNTT